MANHSRNVTRKKIGLVAFVLCAVCSAVLVGRLFYLQIVDGDRYKQLALNQQLKDTGHRAAPRVDLRYQHENPCNQ